MTKLYFPDVALALLILATEYSSGKDVDVFKERHVVTNFWTECSPFGITFSPVLAITAAESQTSTLRLPAPIAVAGVQTGGEADKQTSRQTAQRVHTDACALSVYFSRIKLGHTPYLCCRFFFSLLQLYHSHANTHRDPGFL